MDEELFSLARQYSRTRGITLHERLGFGIHGIVFAAEDKTKPGFFAVKFHREHIPFTRECRVYRRLQEEWVTRILDFNVPQLLRIDEEWHAIEMTVVPQPFLLDFADAFLDQPPDFSDDVLSQWEQDNWRFSAENGRRLSKCLQPYVCTGFICSTSIEEISLSVNILTAKPRKQNGQSSFCALFCEA